MSFISDHTEEFSPCDKGVCFGELVALVEERVAQGFPFACFRLPSEGSVVREVGLGGVATARALDPMELRGGTAGDGFVMVPFVTSTASPNLLVSERSGGYRVVHLSGDTGGLTDNHRPVSGIPNLLPDGYRTAFGRFLGYLDGGSVEKLVLAHRMELPCISSDEIVLAFWRALAHYPSAFVSLCYTVEAGLWLCASPEVLLRGAGGRYETVALAGTMTRGHGDWSEKNRREHGYVHRFISEVLTEEGIEFRAHGLQTIYSGSLQHLCAGFTLELPNGYAPTALAELLHPTPAVCGTPQGLARDMILGAEGIDRSYYAGYVGWCGAPDRGGEVDLYVHIRCMQLLPGLSLRLYGGGGIVCGSELVSEWEEVLHKLLAVYGLIGGKVVEV